MDSIGMPEFIVIAIIFAFLAVPVALAVGLAIYFVKRRQKASPPPLPPESQPRE